jgi:hypothetical protein
MAFANNRAAEKPRASFQVAGGISVLLRHPFLSGQVNNASPVDEIDISRNLRLNDTFLEAVPMQDSSSQEVLVDGSTITMTNHLMNGRLTLQVMPTTGFVGTGDLIAALHLIAASKDDVGATLTVIQYINGKRRVTIFYGVSVQSVPHLRLAGNSVIPYTVQLLYSGWIQGVSASAAVTAKTIWAVGNKMGVNAKYSPYSIQEEQEAGVNTSLGGIGDNLTDYDDASGDVASLATTAGDSGYPAAIPGDPATVTWSEAVEPPATPPESGSG